jgi:predicted site-specific integrase-resolvase
VVAEGTASVSGLNEEQPNLRKVLTNPKGGIIVVEPPDRLTRCGDGSIATLWELHDRRGDALYPRETADGLVEECVALLTRMAARSSGRRTSKRRAQRMRACGARVLHSEEAGCW